MSEGTKRKRLKARTGRLFRVTLTEARKRQIVWFVEVGGSVEAAVKQQVPVL